MLENKNKPPIIIGICGGASSGKSFIIKWLKEQFNKSQISVCVLKEKNFFKSVEIQNVQDRKHYLKNYDFDTFWAIDWDFFESAVENLK
jgi:uridine kinase